MANFVNLYVPGFIKEDKSWDRSMFAFSSDGAAIVVCFFQHNLGVCPTRLFFSMIVLSVMLACMQHPYVAD